MGAAFCEKIPSFIWIVIHIVLFLLTEYIKDFEGIFFKLFGMGLEFILNIAGALMAFVVLQRIAEAVNWQNSKVFGYLSKNSMPVYLFHQQIIYFVIYYLNGIINPHLHALLNFVVSLSVSLLISCVFMKFRVTRFLIGEK